MRQDERASGKNIKLISALTTPALLNIGHMASGDSPIRTCSLIPGCAFY